MKKLIALLLTVLLCGCSDTSVQRQRGIFVMSTFFSVTEYGGDHSDAVDEAFALAEELEKKLSVTDPESEVSAAGRADGSPVGISPETAELLEKTLYFSRLTDGALDPTLYPVTSEWGFTTGEYKIPDEKRLAELLELTGYEKVRTDGNSVTLPAGMMPDFGATAKGFALEKAAELLKSGGVSSAVLDLGGNIRTVGLKPDGSLWRAAVADPKAPSENLCVIDIGEGAIATSGNYERYFIGEDGERYCHIIDPESGRPVRNGIASLTVVADSALTCDALSTALFVMGDERAGEFWRENGGFEMVIVRENGVILYTGGLKESFRSAKGHEGALTEVITR